MRFYPTGDVGHYWEFPSCWELCCREPHKSWYRKPLQKTHVISHWRDLKGCKKESIMKDDLYFEDWPYDRIRYKACLPLYYAVGKRYIGISKAFPVGFKCTPLPINLQELRAIKDYIREKKALRKQAKAAEKIEKRKQKLKVKH